MAGAATSQTRHALWDASVGAAAALLVFVAVPGVLVGFVGLPLPRHWEGHDVLSWTGLFDALAVVSWCAWAACAWPILRAAVTRVRTRDLGAAERLTDRLGLRIALGVLALSSFFGVGASVAGATAPRSAATRAACAPASAVSARSRTGPFARPLARPLVRPLVGDHAPLGQRGTRPAARPRGTRAVAVHAGDTLATLAAAHYGDSSAWHAIASANLGRLMADGTRFVDPTALRSGWVLALPALDAQALRGVEVGELHGSQEPPGRVPPEKTTPARVVAASHDPVGSLLPIAELAGAGVSALVAGLLARRARQLRRLQAFLREEGGPSPAPDERDASLGTFVAPFEEVPLVDVVEAAARLLGDALGTLQPTPGPVQWLRAGHDGVEVRFAEPVPDRLPGWSRTDAGTWHLPATLDVAALSRRLARDEPWCTALLPLGDDDRGTWLLPVDAGACVAVVGPRAADLLLAMRAGVATWSWHEALLVTDDVGQATNAAFSDAQRQTRKPGQSAGTSSPGGPRVLFVGNPDDLPAPVRGACAVLATDQVDDADVTVIVDQRGASAHPLGLTVRPPLLDRSWTSAVRKLTEPSPARIEPGTLPLVHHRVATATLHVTDPTTEEPGVTAHLFSWSGTAPGDDAAVTRAVPVRGPAEVRLLTSVPRLVGLRSDLPPKRARRAVEVVAYLALHAPDPVTGDRLRTRVLGSADADAAAKTLFNTIGAARRSLGPGPDGEPLLPPASRSGHYRLSPALTADAVRAPVLLGAGLAAHDPAEAVARLREGLQLVEGEPLGGVLTGYAWWRTEGHERRVADAVVDGACALVRGALGSGDIDLARWALAQARKVEPYGEALTRAAMRVAAAAGDAPRLHAEWQECQRRMDELDPGGTPSARSEQLYVLLRAQLAGHSPRAGAVQT
ncbi:MAG TPA: bacterial transcriptional activator domain-containing protein [Acidimicrobiales bacterium]|nr:bacterial transcriptional activator domain-containing protein [Acidimicrobiales bacterium]